MQRNTARILSLLFITAAFLFAGCTSSVPRPVTTEQGKALDYSNFGVHWLKRGCYKDALKLFEESLRLNQGMDNQAGVARDYNNLGTLAMETGDLDKAKEFFNMAGQIQKQVQDDWGLSLTDSNLALLGFLKKDPAQAEKNLQEAYQAARLSKNAPQEASVLNLVGRLYLEKGLLNEAAQSVRKSISLYDENKQSAGLAAACYNMGLISLSDKKPADAQVYFEKALAIDQIFLNYPGIGSDLEMLARINADRADWPEAAAYAVRAFNVYYHRGDIKNATAVYDILEKAVQSGLLSYKLDSFAEKLKQMSSPEFDLPCRQ